ncbi:MAG: hypothetical protein II882_09530 [Lachnospiraceae bacterium]|nr:hypothetical protein [Lachnospiraceae bacterium]
MKTLRGQISVFLALSAVLIFALLCTVLEAGRCACLDYMAGQAAASAVESVFAAFHGDLLDRYGLLACHGADHGTEDWIKTAASYAEKYLAPGAGTAYDASDRLGLFDLSVKEEKTVYITEGNGRIFAGEVLTFMKSAGLSILIQEAFSRLGLYSEEDGLSLLQTLQELGSSEDSSLESILGNFEELKEQVASLAAEGGDEEPGGEGGEAGGSPGQAGEGFSADILEQLKAVRENGLIALVTGSAELSDFSWRDPLLPSALPAAEKAKNADYAEAGFSLGEKLLLGEYLLHRMNCYTDEEQAGSRYEIEYVITGKNSDKAALEAIAARLLLIRVGFNFAYLLTDAEKLAEAEAAAVLIMSIVALPELTAVLKWILVTAWALAESIADIRCLLKGEKIPLWKNKTDWKLAALSMDSEQASGSGRGISYEDYLRLLFYLGSGEEEMYRMMDVIQARLRLWDGEFLMRDHMVCAELSLTAAMAYLYIQHPAFGSLIEAPESRKYTKKAAYGYGRR